MNLYTNAGLILAAAEGMTPRLFDLDMQLLHDAILTLIAVIALFFFASYFFFNPAREFLKKRQDKIRDELNEAKESLDHAKALKSEYEQKLHDINKEAESILSEARHKALDNEAATIARAKEEASAIINRANNEAELEKKRVADDVKKEMVSVASAIAGKVIGENMDTEVQGKLVDDTLKEIGDSTWLS